MDEQLISPVKINLTLRILDTRSDGYHNLRSLFWRKPANERLTILHNCGEIKGDVIDVSGAVIKGENILMRVLDAARRKSPDIPPLHIKLKKYFPAGSGIGAGSGNAAALIEWAAKKYGVSFSAEESAALGADVAFLASGYRIACAQGIGESLAPIRTAFDAGWLLAFPKWASNTAEAYKKLDVMRRSTGWEKPEDAFLQEEETELLTALENGRCAGRLPNDFFDVLAGEHTEYEAAEKLAARTSAIGWGLCGSGSAFFALYGTACGARAAAELFKSENWVSKTYCDME